MSVTKTQENIYNTYLAVSRSSQNKPFKLRQDFTKFDESEYYPLILRLEKIFNQHPEIQPQMYFKAPYALHPSESFNLDFFASLKGVKLYSLYMKTLQSLPCDDPYQLNSIKNSLKFIKEFCIKHNVPIDEYPKYSSNGVYPDWFIHIKNRLTNPITMLGFTNIRIIIERSDKDIIDMLIPDFHETYYSDLSKFNNSSKAKILVNRGLELIRKYCK